MQFPRILGKYLKSQRLINSVLPVSHNSIRKSSVWTPPEIRQDNVCVLNIANFSKINFVSVFSTTASVEDDLDSNTFEKVCEETLESLTEFFEELIESEDKFAAADISYSSGVLTINFGSYGTYIINRQSPNKQIWLSSPHSGPKRYDYSLQDGRWTYKHDSRVLHELLQEEISTILGKQIDLSKCQHSK